MFEYDHTESAIGLLEEEASSEDGGVLEGREPLFFTCENENAGHRLDVYLAKVLEEVSRSYIQKLIKDGRVTVNGKTKDVKKHLLKEGDQVSLDLPPAEPLSAAPEDIPIDVLFEDDELIIVNKPQGMVVHPAPGSPNGTLVNAVLFHCQGRLSSINGVVRPGIVHRIDKDTSGLLMIAKTDRAHRAMAEELKAYKSRREYYCLVTGTPKNATGTIQTMMGRAPNNRLKMAVVKTGKIAITHYEVIEYFDKYTLVKCILETGRTHQIRVHMQHIGHPIVGDPLYGPQHCLIKHDGQLLHAKTLGLTHPVTGETMIFEAPLPNYFETILSALRTRR